MTTTPITSFGYWVRRQRKALDLTQVALAGQVGCAAVTIRKIERDERRPSPEMAELLAEHLAIGEAERDDFLDLGRGRYVDEIEAPAKPVENPLINGQIPHNLPPQPTPFIGRAREIEEIAGYLNDPTKRLITILGPGGMGKTRLALAVGEWVVSNLDEEQNRPADGVFFVPLAAVDEPANIVQTMATAMTLSLDGDRDRRQQLVSYLKRKRLLLLMDNCEHLLDGIDLFAEIIQAAPNVQIVATSRERLQLQGEQLLALSGLDVPFEKVENGELDGDAYTAVQLFQQAVRRVQPSFSLDHDTLPSVIEICRLVAGMPLGIELAAGWLDILPAAEIGNEIRRSLDFLESETRNMPERHRSMRAVFDGSWQQMNKAEQEIFTKLSVFRGGFTRHTAGEVAGTTIRQLSRLQSKSLLQFDQENDRYQIHELLRQFGIEKLGKDKERETAVRSAHAAYFCTFLHERETPLKSAGLLRALQEIDGEIDNVRRAWDWAAARGDVARLQQAAESLAWFYHWSSRHDEGLTAFAQASGKMEALLAKTTEPMKREQRLWAKLLVWQANFAEEVGQKNEIMLICQKALDILTDLENADLDTRSEKAHLLRTLGCERYYSDPATSIHSQEQSLILYRELEDRWGIATTLESLGVELFFYAENIPLAESYFREAWQIVEILNHPWQKMWVLVHWGLVLARLGRFEEGDRRLRQAQAISNETHYRPGILACSTYLAMVAIERGQFGRGQDLLREAATFYIEFEESAPMYEGWIEADLAVTLTHQGNYDEAEAKAIKAIISHDKHEIHRQSAKTKAYLAALKLVQNKHNEAQSLCEQAVQVGHKLQDPSITSYAELLLSYSLLKQNKATKTGKLIVDALDFALPRRRYLYVLMAVATGAFYHAANEDPEKAITLYSLAQSHGYVGNSRWFADVVGQKIEEVAAFLPPGVVTAAQARGGSLDLWATAEALLNELKANGEAENL